MVERVKSITGTEPWKIIATGFTAGLLAARALKSPAVERSSEH